MSRINGAEVEAGDILMSLGESHRITRIEPYLHPTIREPGWRIAYDAAGTWSIVLEPGVIHEVT